MLTARRCARYAWAAPCTAVGLLLALAALLIGAQWRVERGVLEVSLLRRPSRRTQPRRHALRFCAITFGHVVIGLDAPTLAHWRAHERVHVQQYERWGLLFFLAYPLASLWQLLRGRRMYADNPFEVQARERAAQ
jgi:hypothetical protein